MSVINSQPLIGASGNQGGGYNLTNSLRFRKSATAFLNRTPTSAGNRQKFTWSAWVKGFFGGTTVRCLLGAGNGAVVGNQNANLLFYDGTFQLGAGVHGVSTDCYMASSSVYRDPSAWYHVVMSVDTTQATESNRVKLYINGNLVTAFSSLTYPAQNYSFSFNNTVPHKIGETTSGGESFDGQMTEVLFIDGQQLTPSSFGENDILTGVWKPKKYASTYGTNGFYFPFTDIALTSGSNTGLGKDFSGNSNYYNTNNISITAGTTYDSMTDVPTLTSATAANYATFNPLQNIQFGGGGSMVFSDGNLRVSNSNNSGQSFGSSSISVSSGKFYAEMVINRTSDGATGIWKTPIDASALYYQLPNNVNYYSGGAIYFGSSTTGTTYSSYTTGDVIGVALDMDNGKIYFSKNGTWQGSSDPAAGTNPAYSGLTGSYQFGAGQGGGGGHNIFNFGQRPFAYTPPSGFVALNTFNLPTSTIVAGNKVMDATTYTGNGSTQAIVNAGAFKPDLVWIKMRSGTDWHILQDSVRGVGKNLNSNNTNAESGNAGDLITSFNTNGFTVNSTYLGSSNTTSNGNGSTFVGWQWQAGQGTTSSNTSGSITSTVSVNATAGFSIVSYTGTGSNATVGHGLGVAPAMIIVRNRSISQNFIIGHTSVWDSNVNSFLLFTSSATSTNSAIWNGARPTSTTISIGSDSGTNGSGNSLIAYCWSEIAGFSKFGSFVGNGTQGAGPFVYTGFRPKYVLIKNINGAYNWHNFDSVRSPSNYSGCNVLKPDTSDSELTARNDVQIDILSNGFRLIGNDIGINQNGSNHIYMAFAENPTKFALAR